MTNLESTRIETSPSGTISVLTIDKRIIGFILEPQWKMNETLVSSIPTGQYFYQHYSSKKFKRQCIKIIGVYDRENISIHPGNTIEDTRGCLLPGLTVGHLNGKRALLHSNDCLDAIIANTLKSGIITIREEY